MMAKCKNCMNFKLIDEAETKYKFCTCTMDSKDPEEERECAFYKHMTNGDRVRNMTDEELTVMFGFMADRLPSCYGCPIDKEFCKNRDFVSCERSVEKWLQSPVEE